MRIGNPYKFAIFADVVEEWNDSDLFFKNGVLLLCVDGHLFPKEVVTATLSCEIQEFRESLMNIKVHKNLFNMPKEKAYIEIHQITFPDDFNIDNDYSFDITPYSLSDNCCYIFAVSNGEQIRILAAEVEYDKEESRSIFEDIKVSEAFITYNELNEIVERLDTIIK